jgi:hypothetical protein
MRQSRFVFLKKRTSGSEQIREQQRSMSKRLESDVVGQLLSATGQDGEDSKEKRWRKKAGHCSELRLFSREAIKRFEEYWRLVGI